MGSNNSWNLTTAELPSELLSYDEKTKIITSKDLEFKIPPEGLGYCLYESLKKYKGNTAQIDIDTGEKDSYESLFKRSIRCAISMQNYGLQSGDTISTYSHNQFDCGATFLAATFLGAINANLDPLLPPADLKYLLQLVTPKLLFVSEEGEDLAKNIIQDLKLATKIVVFGETSNAVAFSKFIEPNAEKELQFKPYICQNLNETILILFSSGTTGTAKGVCLDHNWIFYQTYKPTPSVTYYTNTLYWITPTILFVASLKSGTTTAICKKINHELLWDNIEKYKIEFVPMAAYHIMKFIACKPPQHKSNLKGLLVLGSSLSKENMLKIKQELPHIFVATCYGMTEIGLVAYPCYEICYNKHISVGFLMNNIACKIVDPETEEPLSLKQKGEVRVKTKYPLKGFYMQSSSDLFDKDGFYKTGDIGYFDDDYCLFIVDRIKSVFKYRNHHISPTKIESLITNHPDVQNAAVIPVPHAIDDNHILAVVELKENSKATEASIEKDCNDQLDDIYKITAGVKIIDALPLTPTGKIARNDLKNTMLKEMGYSINYVMQKSF